MKAIVCIFLIVLFSIGSVVLLGAALNIAKILPMVKKYRTSKKIHRSRTAVSVYGTITFIDFKKLSEIDTEYYVTLDYEYNGNTYTKNVTLLNQSSVRAGQKRKLLIDPVHPENSTLEDGSEFASAGNLMFKFTVDIIVIIFIGLNELLFLIINLVDIIGTLG